VTDPPDVLGTPAPVVRTDRVASLVADVWGLRVGTVRPLSSERDANILLDGRYVLKVSNPAEDPSGAPAARVIDDAGAACLARLITVVPGSPAEGRPGSSQPAPPVLASVRRAA
jgi:hypothetical protein